MAKAPALSTPRGGEIFVGSEFRDSLSLLNVLYANQFEGQSFNPKDLEQTEIDFYRGAPPKWLNFHISEQAESGGTGAPFIKRDGYDTLVEKIQQKRNRPGTSAMKLFHQPGCGGTTLAMKVLWDLRKTFRCAVLTGSTSDITSVAKEVVYLFAAGSRGNENTVLLLLNDEQMLENLQDSIMKEIAEQEIVAHGPVVIVLSCVRIERVLQGDCVVLQEKLSDPEKQKFYEKKEELSRKYGEKCKQFHGFNIMQTNFSQDYIHQVCTIFSEVQRANKPKKTQLAAFLSLLNAYVPGSYLLESQCLDFFKHDDYMHGDFSLEDRMKPFSDLIVIFQQDKTFERKVCMAHPMIAQHCTELMAQAGVSRSDTARNFLTCFCGDEAEVPSFVLGFLKDMLTKRSPKPKETDKDDDPTGSAEIMGDTERFSRLILDIQKMEDKKYSASVLRVATKKFNKNPFFPQALARFYYIELKCYKKAEVYAKIAEERDPQNSFVADTLGQVHKNHLKNIKHPAKAREILQLAQKAIEAFKHEEQLAENEKETDMKEDGMTKVSHIFNNRGKFGYLQVCNLVYDLLVRQNETWRDVLTKHVSLGSVLESLGDNKLFRFNGLINSLRDEVKRKCEFFDKYLTYSEPEGMKGDPPYIFRDTSECYRKYVGDSPQNNLKQNGSDFIQQLKQNLAAISTQGLTCLDIEYSESALEEITQWWEEIFQRSSCRSLPAFKEKLPLNRTDEPELHLLVLLLCWPTDRKHRSVSDLSQLIHRMSCSYEHAYKKYFRSRNLKPLCYIGKGQGLDRVVHSKVLEEIVPQQNKKTNEDRSNMEFFQHPLVKEVLHRFEGLVRNYRIYVTIGGEQIEVEANQRKSLWKSRKVSFYLGFTIRGPVAFGIQTKTAEKVPEISISHPEQMKSEASSCTDTTRAPEQHFVDRHQSALITRVKDPEFILDKLMDTESISAESCDTVKALESPEDQMRAIIQGLTLAGKDALYEILKKAKSMRPLIQELEETE